MKFAVFTVMVPDLTLEQTVHALKKHGYDGVEWRVNAPDPAKQHEKPSFWGNNLSTVSTDATVKSLQDLSSITNQAGLRVPNLASYLQCGDLGAVERDMKIAVQLGAPSLRVGVPGYDRSRNYHDLLAESKTYLAGVQELSQQLGIKGLIEIHMGNIASSASLAYRLVEGFDPEHIGVIYDPGNMVFEGFEQYRLGLELLGPYLKHVHIKNALWKRKEGATAQEHIWEAVWARMEEGIVPWRQVIQDLKAIGYDDWLSFEDFSGSGTTEQLLERNLVYIKSFL